MVVGAARAESHACAGHPRPRWVAQTVLGVSLVPTGVEIQARGGVCVPLRPSGGEWVDTAAVEVGAVTYVSPVYAYGGGYVQVTPLDVLQLRIEVMGLGYWPLPLDGAGYYSLLSPGAARGPRDLPGTQGRSATGYAIRASATLQGRLVLGGGLAFLAWNTVVAERVSLGPGPYWVNLTIDHTVRASELVLGDDLVLLLEVAVPGGTYLRMGASDAMRAVTGTGAIGNSLGGAFIAGWPRPIPEIAWMEIGLRAGAYTHHPIRTGMFTLSLWLSVEWDAGSI
jgi:hypothetical protein